LALLLGLGLNVLFFGLFRIATPSVAPAKFPPVYVHYAGATGASSDAALNEQAELFDSEPLFLPTPWNFAARSFATKPMRPQPFSDFTAKTPEDGNFSLPSNISVDNHDPVAALRPGQWLYLGVLGQAPNPTAKLPPRGALLRTTRIDTGASAGPVVLDETLSVAAVPNSTQNLAALWGPATYLLLFSGTGSVGVPLLVNSSGIDAVDDDWRNWLDDHFRRHPLPPGTYQAVVGP